jgi:hypothetical protein
LARPIDPIRIIGEQDRSGKSLASPSAELWAEADRTRHPRGPARGPAEGAIGLSLRGIGNGRGAAAEIEAGATCPYIGRRSRRDRHTGRKPWLTFD